LQVSEWSPIDADQRESRLLRIASAARLLRSDLALRVVDDNGASLIFPSELRGQDPVPGDEMDAVTFVFSGPPLNVYASTVVRLARSGFMRLHLLTRRRARFMEGEGTYASLTLREMEGTRGEMTLSFSVGLHEEARRLLDAYVNSQVERHAAPGSVERRQNFYCGNCAEKVRDQASIQERLNKGLTTIQCLFCQSPIIISDRRSEPGRASPQLPALDRAADVRRDLDLAAMAILGKQVTNDFDVFCFYGTEDNGRVREIGEVLKQQGILPWFGYDDDDSPSDYADHWVRKSRSAAVFIGRSREIYEWQVVEKFAQALKPIMPVLLPGAEQSDIPPSLEDRHIVDLRDFTPAAMERFMSLITSRPAKYIGGDIDTGEIQTGAQAPAQEVKPSRQSRSRTLKFDSFRFFTLYTRLISRVNRKQLDGLKTFLSFIEQDKRIYDVRQAAYLFAVTQFETGNAWTPIDEIDVRSDFQQYEPGTRLGRSLGNTQRGDSKRFRGRGYIQVTGRSNYQKLSERLGLDLIADPELALKPEIAYQILSYGLLEGFFNRRKPEDFFTGLTADYGKLYAVPGQGPARAVLADIGPKFEAILRETMVVDEPIGNGELQSNKKAKKATSAAGKTSIARSSSKSQRKKSVKSKSAIAKVAKTAKTPSRKTSSKKSINRKTSVARSRSASTAKSQARAKQKKRPAKRLAKKK
jgi:hypothetical protein